MRKAKKSGDRQLLSAHKGWPSPTVSSSNAPGFERHDHEGGERNGDDVGADSVEAGAVEMEQGERDQGELDRKPGQDQPHGPTANSHEYALVAALEQPPRPGGRVRERRLR